MAKPTEPEVEQPTAPEESAKRRLEGAWREAIIILAAIFSAFFIYTTFARVPFHVSLAIYLSGSLFFIFALYPATKRSPRNKPSLFDLMWMVFSVAPSVYFVLHYEEMMLRAGIVTKSDMLFGAMIILAALEACRRVIGATLPVLAILFIVYDLLGPHLPGLLAHRGFGIERIIGTIFGYDGIYGVVTRTYASYVLIFIIFGSFLQRTGAGEAFTNLALALVGRSKGGAAKTAVFSSGLAGMVLGSGAANITVTGTFTIPLMKRTGYPAHYAGAVETVASIGGHVVPPVMGAAAFLLASFTGYPYSYIAIISAAPAFLLYVALYASVHFHAMKDPNIQAVSEDMVPPISTTLKRDGILLLPILVLVGALVFGFSPFRAAILAILCTVVASWLRGKDRITFRGIVEALADGTISSLVVGSTAGVMGVMLAALLLPGLPLMFSSWVIAFSHGSLILALVLIFIASYILGMGMTITAAYILCAIVAVPALMDFGIPLLTAHLVILWLSQDSSFTPPFALGAFVAAGIANSHPMKTAWQSVLLGKAFYVVPMLMIWTPLLGLDGFGIEFWRTFATCTLAMIVFSSITERFWFRRHTWLEMILLAVAMILLMWPAFRINLLGLLVLLAVLVPQKLQVSRATAVAAGA